MGWTVRGSIPDRDKSYVSPKMPRPAWARPSSLSMGTGGSFSGVKQPCRGAHHSPYLVWRLRSRAVPELPVRAFMACTRTPFLFLFHKEFGTVGVELYCFCITFIKSEELLGDLFLSRIVKYMLISYRVLFGGWYGLLETSVLFTHLLVCYLYSLFSL